MQKSNNDRDFSDVIYTARQVSIKYQDKSIRTFQVLILVL